MCPLLYLSAVTVATPFFFDPSTTNLSTMRLVVFQLTVLVDELPENIGWTWIGVPSKAAKSLSCWMSFCASFRSGLALCCSCDNWREMDFVIASPVARKGNGNGCSASCICCLVASSLSLRFLGLRMTSTPSSLSTCLCLSHQGVKKLAIFFNIPVFSF